MHEIHEPVIHTPGPEFCQHPIDGGYECSRPAIYYFGRKHYCSEHYRMRIRPPRLDPESPYMNELAKMDLDDFNAINRLIGLGTKPRSLRHMDVAAITTVVRNAIKRLEALAYGCPTGTHLQQCTCKPAVKGESFIYFKRKIREKQKD